MISPVDENSRRATSIISTSNTSLQELEELSSPESAFVFSKFAEFNKSSFSLPELLPDSIIQGEDGVFSISPDINFTDIVQDGDFRKLVESVLKN